MAVKKCLARVNAKGLHQVSNVLHSPIAHSGNSTSRAARTRITGYRRALMRALWGSLLVLNLILFFTGLLVRFDEIITHTETIQVYSLGPTPLDIPTDLALIYRTILDVVIILGFWIVAILIFWRKSDDWLAIFVSLMLITLGFTATTFPMSVWSTVRRSFETVNFNTFLAFWLFLNFLLLFPSGKFVPGWTVYLSVAFGSWLLLWHFFPASMPFHLDRRPPIEQFLAILLWLFIGVLSQLYRRAHLTDRIELQQTHWLTFGFVTSFVAIGFANLGSLWLGVHFSRHSFAGLLFWCIMTAIFASGMLIVPITLGISILRHRLFDIQTVISRTLIYALLTGILTLIYLGSSGLFQQVAKSVGGDSDNLLITEVKVLIATLITLVLFKPIENRLHTIIDRRFHREKINVEEMFAAFSREIYMVTNMSELFSILLRRIDGAIHINHGAVFLSLSEDQFLMTAAFNIPLDPQETLMVDPATLDKLWAGVTVSRSRNEQYTLLVPLVLPRFANSRLEGVIALGRRLSEQDYSKDDKELLIGLANQVSIALYVIQMVNNAQTVTARRRDFPTGTAPASTTPG